MHCLTLIPAEQAVTTLKAFWPPLFEGGRPHLLATGMREALFADIDEHNLPLSHKQVLTSMKSLTRADVYLTRMRAGAGGFHGNAVATVTVLAYQRFLLFIFSRATAQMTAARMPVSNAMTGPP